MAAPIDEIAMFDIEKFRSRNRANGTRGSPLLMGTSEGRTFE
ncbi:hypothetical protein [Rhodococcus pyridinivorans]